MPIFSHSEEYKSWIIELKQKIRRCQIKAAIKVNTELLKLYWQMGKDINEKSLVAKWGAGFFDKLSRDLKTEFPEMTGFSVTNLKYIKRFYMFYNQSDIIRQQVVDEIELPIFKSCRIKLHLNLRNSRSPSSLPWNRKPYLSF